MYLIEKFKSSALYRRFFNPSPDKKKVPRCGHCMINCPLSNPNCATGRDKARWYYKKHPEERPNPHPGLEPASQSDGPSEQE